MDSRHADSSSSAGADCGSVPKIYGYGGFHSDVTSISRRARNAVPYQLVEIPSGIFRSLSDAPLQAFNADGPTVDCSYAGLDVAARVSLDRSDSKITIKQIQLTACTEHVTWEMLES